MSDISVILNKCDAPVAYLPDPDDQAVWSSGDRASYAIAFYAGPPGSSRVSPFTAGAVFTVKPGGATPSGGIWSDAAYGDYKYRVVGDNGCDIDPKLHIGP